MNYRTIGNPPEKVSILGFGLMRLPVLDNDYGKIDIARANMMMEFALESGINYYDTAYPYHQEQSEIYLGKFLLGRRDKVFIADKLPCWKVEEKKDFDTLLEEQLKRLQTDYIDFYLLHALNRKSWEKVNKLGILDWLNKKKIEGRIRHIGFSFHDDLPVFKQIVQANDWEFCQIQYNFMDTEFQAGSEGFEFAAARGIDLVIMEPLKGGLIAADLPESIFEEIENPLIKKSHVNLSLNWLWQKEAVKVVLSGMSTLRQIMENCGYASSMKLGLNSMEKQYLYDLKEAYQERRQINCTNCKYCQPCPQGVAIPNIFEIYNTVRMFEDKTWGRRMYNFLKKENRVENCIECGECEKKCPQNLAIIKELKKAEKLLKGE